MRPLTSNHGHLFLGLHPFSGNLERLHVRRVNRIERAADDKQAQGLLLLDALERFRELGQVERASFLVAVSVSLRAKRKRAPNHPTFCGIENIMP